MSVKAGENQGDLYRSVLSSIELGGKPLFSADSPPPRPLRTIGLETLESDKLVQEAIKLPDSMQAKLINGRRSPSAGVPPDANVDSETDVRSYSRDLIILRHRKASYTNSARAKLINGAVTLMVTFLANGQLGTIELLQSLDKGLDDEAFKAAKRIKFLPALVDGKPVDVTRKVTYSFNIY